MSFCIRICILRKQHICNYAWGWKMCFMLSEEYPDVALVVSGNWLDSTVLSIELTHKWITFMSHYYILREFCKSKLMRSKLSFRRNLCIFGGGMKEILISHSSQVYVITTDIRNKTELTLRITGFENVSM